MDNNELDSTLVRLGMIRFYQALAKVDRRPVLIPRRGALAHEARNTDAPEEIGGGCTEDVNGRARLRLCRA